MTAEYALELQIPSEKVFRPQKTTPNSVSEGVWSCSDGKMLFLFELDMFGVPCQFSRARSSRQSRASISSICSIISQAIYSHV